MKITGAQIRAARAFLDWTIAQLAEKSSVGISTVRAIEGAEGTPDIKTTGVETTREYRVNARQESLGKLVRALQKAGITFLPPNSDGAGLRGRGPKSK